MGQVASCADSQGDSQYWWISDCSVLTVCIPLASSGFQIAPSLQWVHLIHTLQCGESLSTDTLSWMSWKSGFVNQTISRSHYFCCRVVSVGFFQVPYCTFSKWTCLFFNKRKPLCIKACLVLTVWWSGNSSLLLFDCSFHKSSKVIGYFYSKQIVEIGAEMSGFEYFFGSCCIDSEYRSQPYLKYSTVKSAHRRREMPGSRIQGPKLICITGEIRLETNPLFCRLYALNPNNQDKSHSSHHNIRGENLVSDALAGIGSILIGFKW